jgi:hypothetical protein
MRLPVIDAGFVAGLVLASAAAVAASVSWEFLAGVVCGIASVAAVGGIISNAE